MIEIPENKDKCELTHEERVDIIARVFLRGDNVMTDLNCYGGGRIERCTMKDEKTGKEKEWYATEIMAGCPDTRYGHEILFLPGYGEVQDALEQFKKKGWHAYFDSEMRQYKVCKERYQRGEYADRHTTWLF